MSLKQIASGAALISSINIIRLLLQTLSIPLLAHFLSPEDYGLSAIAMPIISFGMMLAQSGLGTSLVRADKNEVKAWHSCFWISIGFGLILTAIVAAASPLVGILANDARMGPILAALAFTIAVQTASVIPSAALQQNCRYGTTATIEIISLVTGICVAILCAIDGLGVWSLIWQQLSSCLARTILTTVASPYRCRAVFCISSAKSHLIFGWHILGANMALFVGRSIESIFIGRLLGPSALGIYSMAYQLAKIPFLLVGGPIQYVIYPHITDIKHNPDKLNSLFLLTTRLVASILIPSVGLAIFASETIFNFMLPEAWSHAATIFKIIAPAATLQALVGVTNTFLMGIGRTEIQIRLAAQSALIGLVGVLLSAWYGLTAMSITYSIFSIVFSLRSINIYLPLLGCPVLKYLKTFFKPSIICFSAVGIYHLIISFTSMSAMGDTLSLAFVCTVAVAIGLSIQRTEILTSIASWQNASNF